MLVATLLMLVGIGTVAALSHRRGYRLGGAMTVPVLAVYTFREPLSPLVFAVGIVAAWGALWATREFTLNHGRRVFLVAVLAGAAATVVAAYVLAHHTPVDLPFDDAEVVASIFPGVAAYNLMRLDPDQRVADAALTTVVFAGLVLLGVAGLVVLEGRGLPTPPILALPTSDLVTWLGVEPRGDPVTQITPNWLSVALLVVDVSVYEFVRSRYDVRLAGIIVIPLVAVFSLRFAHVVALFAVGATVIYVVVSVVHWLTLLYGRVLLGVSLLLGNSYALALGVLVPTRIPGLTLFFLGLFVGIAAYNLYRSSPKVRAASLRISAGLFVAFYAILLAFVDVPPAGLFHDGELAYGVLGVIAVGLALRELYHLERSRPSVDAFAEASVFANFDGDDGDGATSPLVDGNRESAAGGTANAASASLFSDGGTDGERATESPERGREHDK